MKKRGFTLIELLAVIVILAVIALIAVPNVLNVIEDSRKSKAEISARNIARAAETYYANQTLLGETILTELNLVDGPQFYDGENPEKGYVYFNNDGKSYVKLYTEGYCVISNYDRTISSVKTDKDKCGIALFVFLELEGGRLDNTILEYEQNNTFDNLPIPLREGYTFKGWFTKEDKEITSSDIVTSTVTLYAKWEVNKYIVTLSSEVEIPSIEGWTLENGVYTREIEYDTVYGILPTLTKIGYSFQGWHTIGGVKIEKDTILKQPNNHTLFSQFIPNVYEITLKYNDGKTADEIREVTYNSEYGELPVPLRAGYTFNGWYLNNVKLEETTIVKETNDHILEGKWDANKYSVTFNRQSYVNGEEVYFNPVTAKICNASEAISTTGTKDGCMKWYAFLDDGSDKINLILDHNTTSYVAWNTDVTKNTPDTALAQLALDTENWNTEIKSTARIISAAEVNSIAKTISSLIWNMNDYNTNYYLHTGSKTKYAGAIGSNFYDWLFDNTYSCTRWGCNKLDNGTYGYWTSSYTGARGAWDISDDGALHQRSIADSTSRGIRPVIKVNKALLNKTKEVIYNEKYDVLTELYREGYTFKGWYTTGGVKIEETTIFKHSTDQNLYAQWEANKYIITLKYNDDKTNNTTKEVIYNNIYGELPILNREGYTFLGWYDDVTKIENSTIVKITNNKMLEAKWEANKYTITFKYNNGENDTKKEITYGNIYGELPEPIKEGYIFQGWFTTNGVSITNDMIVSTSANQILNAQWSVNGYTVTFNANGGKVTPSYATINYDSAYGELPVPTREGYTFKGWFTSSNGGIEVTSSTIVKTASNHSIYAQWTANTYKVTLNANKGYFGETEEIETSFKDKTLTLKENTKVPTISSSDLNLSTNQKYLVTFDYVADGTNNFNVDLWPDSLPEILPTATTTKQSYSWLTSSSNSDIEKSKLRFFNNRYTVNPYNIYISNVHLYKCIDCLETSSKNVIYDNVYGNLTIPKRNGYIFDGWATSGGIKITEDSIVTIASDINLYAQWKTSDYTITFDANGGHFGELEEIETSFKDKMVTLKEDARVPIFGSNELNLLTNQQYLVMFDYWADGSNTINVDFVPDGLPEIHPTVTTTRKTYNWLINSSNSNIQKTRLRFFNDIYVPNPYNTYITNIHLYKCENCSLSKTKVVTLTNSYGTLPVPTREGYDFKGWATSSGTLITSDSIVSITKDTSLYAQWQIKSYTITFNSNGGTKISNISVNHGETITSLPTPEKSGYKFLGWYNASGNKLETISSVVTNYTLNAQWLKIEQLFTATGNPVELNLPAGKYKIELWGAKGGDDSIIGASGAYVSGVITFNKETTLFVYVGGKGNLPSQNENGGWNGGGASNAAGAGGGATDIRLVSGGIKDFDSLKSRIMVAAGGGGAEDPNASGSAGGGLTSNATTKQSCCSTISGSTQTSGFAFGYAKTTYDGVINWIWGGGGSGYYGGYSGVDKRTAGSGGTSFISGHNGCNAIAVDSTETSIIHTGQPNHYSGYIFSETVMIDGDGYSWTNVKKDLQVMPNPNGGYYELGKGNSNNGFARITYIEE